MRSRALPRSRARRPITDSRSRPPQSRRRCEGSRVCWAPDLRRAHGRALIHVGATQDATVHALGAAINHTLGAHGETLSFIEPVAPPPQPAGSLSDLTSSISHGQVDTLIILADNPV